MSKKDIEDTITDSLEQVRAKLKNVFDRIHGRMDGEPPLSDEEILDRLFEIRDVSLLNWQICAASMRAKGSAAWEVSFTQARKCLNDITDEEHTADKVFCAASKQDTDNAVTALFSGKTG